MRQGRKFPKSLERSKSFFCGGTDCVCSGNTGDNLGCVYTKRERETQPIRTPSVTVVISNKMKLYSPPPPLLFDRISPSGFRLLLILWIFGSVSFYTGLILCVCRQCTNHGPKQLSVGFFLASFDNNAQIRKVNTEFPSEHKKITKQKGKTSNKSIKIKTDRLRDKEKGWRRWV